MPGTVIAGDWMVVTPPSTSFTPAWDHRQDAGGRMPGPGKGRSVTFEFTGENSPVKVSAVVGDAPPLEPGRCSGGVAGGRSGPRRAAGGEDHGTRARSFDSRGSATLRCLANGRGEQGPARASGHRAVFLVVFVLRVRAKGLDYTTSYLGPPLPVAGMERLAPARAAGAPVHLRLQSPRRLQDLSPRGGAPAATRRRRRLLRIGWRGAAAQGPPSWREGTSREIGSGGLAGRRTAG